MRSSLRQEGSTTIVPDADLAVLYERRRIVEDLIHALERYDRIVPLGTAASVAKPKRAA